MTEALFVALCVALVASCIYLYLNRRDTKRQLQEYKELFEVASSSQKEIATKVEELYRTLTGKDILLERAAQGLEAANAKCREFIEEVAGLKSAVQFQEEQFKKLFHQKKSSEVRTGKITEQIAPFLEDYPLDPQTARFIGDPIDFVHFDEGKVTFVEVKSGKSQLSKKQRQIRDLIKEGKVEFTIYRVEGK